jgi:CRISPR system Cascade subunit CasA
MNLLDEAWIPVRRDNGKQDWITPLQISDPTIISLDARRPDFNGALIQFLIGLVQTTTPMDSEIEWKQWNEQPPTAEQLQQWFEPVREAFVFDGDGARFMQDFGLRTGGIKDNDGSWRNISGLLIDAPAGKSLDDNTDHFIKRSLISSMCPHCAALALFTLQTNAPEGGRGHYTSLRGGGPLTTILVPNTVCSLWHKIWPNVIEISQFNEANGNAQLNSLSFKFPWLDDIEKLQPPGGKTTPIQVHPVHVFWGMPRKIRLDEDSLQIGICDVCDRYSENLYTKYVTKPNGFNYKHGWNHLLSPYYESKNSETKQLEWLAVHPQQGGIGYKDWFGFLLGIADPKRRRRPASVVNHFLNSSSRKKIGFGLWVFGYDMDSNKACCWYESTFPLYGLTEKNISELSKVQREIECWLKAADDALYFLSSEVKAAWFSRKPDGKLDIRGDFSFIDSCFWSQTENGFYQLLRSLIEQARGEDEDIVFTPLREQWRDLLIKTAIRLFDADLVGAAPIAQQNPRRTSEAYNRLCASLRGDKLKEVLKLPTAKAEKKTKKSNLDAA